MEKQVTQRADLPDQERDRDTVLIAESAYLHSFSTSQQPGELTTMGWIQPTITLLYWPNRCPEF